MSDIGKKVDESWKAQVRAEKAPGPASESRTPAPSEERSDFLGFISMLAMQAAMACGLRPHPMTGKRMVDLDAAQSTIDILEMLAEKTRGNLTPEEDREFREVLSEVRLAFVQVSSPKPK